MAAKAAYHGLALCKVVQWHLCCLAATCQRSAVGGSSYSMLLGGNYFQALLAKKGSAILVDACLCEQEACLCEQEACLCEQDACLCEQEREVNAICGLLCLVTAKGHFLVDEARHQALLGGRGIQGWGRHGHRACCMSASHALHVHCTLHWMWHLDLAERCCQQTICMACMDAAWVVVPTLTFAANQLLAVCCLMYILHCHSSGSVLYVKVVGYVSQYSVSAPT